MNWLFPDVAVLNDAYGDSAEVEVVETVVRPEELTHNRAVPRV
jgi:hypothetical protein